MLNYSKTGPLKTGFTVYILEVNSSWLITINLMVENQVKLMIYKKKKSQSLNRKDYTFYFVK